MKVGGSTSSVNEINSYAATYFAIYWYINALQTYFAYSSCGKLRSSYVNLYSLNEGKYSISKFVKELLAAYEELRMYT